MKNFLSQKRNRLILGILFLFIAGSSVFLFKNHFFLSEDKRFETFTKDLFHQEISSNTLNLHYTLAYPEEYGIDEYNISLGCMDPKILKKNQSSIEKLQKQLQKFSPQKLSSENQMIYDILLLETATQLSVKDLYLLEEPLGPNLGIQAQLPVLLAEYTFRTSSDIKDYFSLLASMPNYFEEILEFETEKSKQGLFMSDTSADRIIEQCNAFVQDKKNNYLYEMFNQRTEDLLSTKRISKKQADSFIEMNEKLMDQFVFPAYETLAKGLSRLKGSGKNENGLSHLPGGRAYYEYLVKSTVGDYRSIEEIEKDLYNHLTLDYKEILALQKKDPDILAKATQIPLTSSWSPEQMLDYLKHIMADDFPALSAGDYEVKYVPESMEEFSSPAFYLTPPIDTLSPNTIYINQGTQVSCAELFTTLAHEGFPGHLYQTLYFSGQSTSPVRQLTGCGGYIEGWATYVENLSYEYAVSFLDIEPDVMQFLCLNRSVSLCLYSLLDIGIHYRGWTLDTVIDTLLSFGITSQDVCREIFQYIVENPANYLKYYLGCLNFTNLRTAVENTQGNSFNLKEFHRNILELGPAPFPIVKKYLLRQYQ